MTWMAVVIPEPSIDIVGWPCRLVMPVLEEDVRWVPEWCFVFFVVNPVLLHPSFQAEAETMLFMARARPT